MTKYYLDRDGNKFGNDGEDHSDIAARVLPTFGLQPQNMGEKYTMMFDLGFARVAEDAREFHIERRDALSAAQEDAMQTALAAGKLIFRNNRAFGETKGVRGTAGTVAEQLRARPHESDGH